jgi:hypothetical protein
MACYSDEQILEYLEGDLSPIEQGLLRDHLLTCPACQARSQRYVTLNRNLARPPAIEPPEAIIRSVMRQLYPEFPRYSSIAAMIAASFFFLVTWIYVYFDFSHNSLIRALQVTSDNASGVFVSGIKVISSLVSYTYASFKTMRALLLVATHVDVRVEIIALVMLTLSMVFFYSLFHLFAKRLRGSNKS